MSERALVALLPSSTFSCVTSPRSALSAFRITVTSMASCMRALDRRHRIAECRGHHPHERETDPA